MSWYRTGSIALQNGSDAVVGIGTAFVPNIRSGFALNAPDGLVYEVIAVASDTMLTISPAYKGATTPGAQYSIVQTQSQIAELSSRAAQLLSSFEGARDDAAASAASAAASAALIGTAASIPQYAAQSGVNAAAAQTARTGAETAAGAASGSATAAAGSATSAAVSATAAADSAATATAKATAAAASAASVDQAATTATTKAGNAATSATNAANSAGAALASQTAAGTSEANASASATAALASKTSAGTSEANASASAGAALASKTAAGTSATNAAASATAAASSKTAAGTSETNASASAASAQASKTAAGTSETNASASAAAALASKTAAATSETNAAASATAAASSKTAAGASETNAATSATAAAASKTAANTSQTNAAGSAAAALVSETAARTSETNAAGSATTAQSWATKTDGEVTAGLGYGAKKYATDAAASAAAAAISANQASTGQVQADWNEADTSSKAYVRNKPTVPSKASLGLSHVDDTADSTKPVSGPQQAALDLKAPLASPNFTGAVVVPTLAAGSTSVYAANAAYVAGEIATAKAAVVSQILSSAPAALDTLSELATALGNDANYAATTAAALGNRVRVDTNAQGLTSTQKANALANLGVDTALALKQDGAAKDAASGYVGLSAAYAITFKSSTGAVASKLTNASSAARTYSFPDKDITVAGVSDLPLPASVLPLAGGAASQGVSANYARADHVHPQQTSGTLQIGDVLVTARSLAAPDWLKADGSTYLKSAYPLLAAAVPFNRAPAGGTWTMLGNIVQSGQALGYINASKDGNFVLVGLGNYGYPQLWAKSGNTFYQWLAINDFGSNPSNCGALSSTAAYVALCNGASASDQLWVFKRGSSTLARINPVGAMAQMPTAMAWSPDDTYLAVLSYSSLFIFKRVGDVLSQIYSVALNNSPPKIIWAPDGTHLLLPIGGAQPANNQVFYTVVRTGDSFAPAVAQYVAFSSAETGVNYDQAISPDGNFVVVSGGQSTHILKRSAAGSANYTYQGSIGGMTYGRVFFGLYYLYVAYSSNQLVVYSYADTFATFVKHGQISVSAATVSGAIAGITGSNVYDDKVLINTYDTSTQTYKVGLFNEVYAFNPTTEFVVPKFAPTYSGVLVDATTLNKQAVATPYIKAS